MISRYAGDPRWMTARFNSNCHKCNHAIVKGGNIFYYPRQKYVLCDRDSCGREAAREFRAAAEDESLLKGETYGLAY